MTAVPDRRSVADAAAAEYELLSLLSQQGLAGADIPTLLEGFCERLRPLGVNIARGHVSTATLDPQQTGFSMNWRPGQGITDAEFFPYGREQPEHWLLSPMHYMLEHNLPSLRCRLGPADDLPFPVLDDFRAQGLTDYFAAMHGFGWATNKSAEDQLGELGMICTWATADGAGFGQELECLQRLLPTFALAVKSAMMWQITHNVFSAYLGPDAAGRVLRGEVRRGSAQSIQAAIVFADLQGFTRLADKLPHADLLAMLNCYFECIVAPIEEHGGQVLKFMGDGLLATFDLAAGDGATGCDSALAAVIDALAQVRTVNEKREADGQQFMELDVALHIGEILYGNIGSVTRLDFTVIGPAVNEAARMETLCGVLGANLLLSQDFRDRLAGDTSAIVALGDHRLRGVSDAKALYTIDRGFIQQ